MQAGRNTAKIFASIAAKIAMAVLFVFCNAFFVLARDIRANEIERVRVHFPFDNAELRSNYMNNESSLISLRQFVEATDGNLVIEVTSYSSPEGNEAYNKALSIRRAASVKSFILSLDAENKPEVKVVSVSESWNQFRAFVAADKSLDASSRSELLLIIDSDSSADQKEAVIKADSNYKRLYSKYFRSLRYADISLRIKNSPVFAFPIKQHPTLGGAVFFKTSRQEYIGSYMNNDTNLAEILRTLNENPDAANNLVIVGAASPEGPLDLNDRLAIMRAQTLSDKITDEIPELKGKLRIKTAGEDWEGLRAAVIEEESLSKSEKSEIVEILDGNSSSTSKKAALKRLSSYKKVSDNCFPKLRSAYLAVADSTFAIVPVVPGSDSSEKQSSADTTSTSTPTAIVPVVVKPAADTTASSSIEKLDTLGTGAYTGTKLADRSQFTEEEEQEQEQADSTSSTEREKNMILALKSNLLYDAVTALNAELEIPVWERLSLNAEFVTPWWETGNKYAFQLQYVSAEVRYWFKPWERFGEDKLRGWYVAPYVAAGQYDFQYDKKINYQGEFWSAGLSAGYAMQLSNNVNLEFSLSVGYLESPFRHYYPTDDYSRLIHDPYRDGTRYWLGPTKAKVSLVIPICVPTGKKKEVNND